MTLADDIQRWLVAEEPSLRGKELWNWGTEAFWIAFTAAYPAFPHGEWPRWNPQINMGGQYIQSWLQDLSDDEGSEAGGSLLERSGVRSQVPIKPCNTG